MKRLILIRHAKSSHKNLHLHDRERPLNKRGSQDTQIMSQWLAEQTDNIELILSSTAKRSWLLAEAIHEKTSAMLQSSESLYTFNSSRLLSVIYELPDTFDNIILVGHNPALTSVVNHFGFVIDNVPTSGVVAFDCDINCWSSISDQNCRLDYFTAPKLI